MVIIRHPNQPELKKKGGECMSDGGISWSKLKFSALVLLVMAASALNIQGLLRVGEQGTSGMIVASAWATTEALEKDVGQEVCFKAKIQNTGDVNATYLIVAKWCEDGESSWETAGQADVTLAPGEYSEVLIVGSLNCVEEMKGKHFDVKFILYDHETETLLDQEELDKAFYVRTTIINGAIHECWIE
jgi:hypothetical protein